MRISSDEFKIIVLVIALTGLGVQSWCDNSWVNYDKKVIVRSLPHQSETRRPNISFNPDFAIAKSASREI